MEHAKAQKKIHETAKKTDELVMLRKRNDERFMRVSYRNLNSINVSRVLFNFVDQVL